MLLLIAALPLAAADDDFLLRGATVHPVSSPEIAGGSVLVLKGKIAAVGKDVAAPKGVKVIEAKGLHVWPGIIDSATQMGLSEIGSVRETNDTGELGEFNPQLRAVVAVNPASEHIPVTRANGITSTITLPAPTERSSSGARNIIAGQAALIHLDGWTWEEMAVRRSAAMQLHFPEIRTTMFSRTTGRPTRIPYADARRSYDEQVRNLEAFFEQARLYRKAKAGNAPDFRADLKMEAMLPVLEGKMPVLMNAVRERAVKDALRFAEREKIRIVLAGTREAGSALPEIKGRNIPVILGKTFELPLEEDEAYDSSYTLPAELHKAGVKFAFGSFSTSFSRNLPFEAANAVAFGLPYEQALRAITLSPAEIWGVDSEIGSIQEGRVADLVVSDGDLLEARTRIKQMFIKGKLVDLDNKHRRLYEKYLNRP